MRCRAQGFSLLELLVVIAIIGVVAGAFAWWLLGSVRRAEVRGAAYQLAGDLRQSRSLAQKTGLPQSVTVQSGTSGYTLRSGADPLRSRVLDKGVRVQALGGSGGDGVTYRPPYGTLDASGVVWEVRSPANVPPLYVKVVGITGKVMVSASQD